MRETPLIVVIDDDPDTVTLLESTLTQWGYRVAAATRGDKGLELALTQGPALLIVDLHMPDPDGFEVIRQLRAHRGPTTLPILAVTGACDDDAAARALEAGANDFFCKPLRLVELRARVQGQLRFGEAVAELERKQEDGRAVLELSQTLASSFDFQEILFSVVSRIAERVQVDRCSIILTGSDPGVGYVVASSDDPTIHDLRITLHDYPEVEKVIADSAPLFVDVGTDPLLRDVRARIPPHGPATSALFPILHEQRPMGVLFLRFRARQGELSERELSLCQTVANATAVALRNARILKTMRDQQLRIDHARTEAERKAEALSPYADFFESSADGMLVVDGAGAILYANPRMASLSGVEVTELTMMKLSDLVTDEDKPVVNRLVAGFSHGQYPRGLDLSFNSQTGAKPTLSVSASSILKLADGVLLMLRDVTEARATEAELRRTKEFLEGLIEQSVDAIIAADMKGRILLFNPAAERVLGYASDDVLGQSAIESFYPPGVAREVMRRIKSPHYGGEGKLEQTRLNIVAKDGTEIPITMTAGMIVETDGPKATFGIFADMRDRLKIEKNLARTQQELLQREREAVAAQLAGAAAHELNQPLTSVMASAELLRRKLGEDSPYAKEIDAITSETARLAEIVRKIGRITRYETKPYVASTQILDLDKAADPGGEGNGGSEGEG